jgi:hypothetical protein
MAAPLYQIHREYTRYNPVFWGTVVDLMIDGLKRIKTAVVDESLGGLGIQVPSCDPLTAGQVVTVQNGLYTRKARVAYVTVRGEQCRVGLAWMPDSGYQ